ncbi:hypothetical protein PHYPSEUDO_012274 [Phytophthora pseudosyringae]|uniref:Uncharacterized protein n=1 Tax=Phytophthora pseudosyringae TaxID=221518 RepID=A0A8T1V9T5_9STRA|nr:hypothetical protein PHYPSEUDO_012274 [Phytophthora pseudosyringae]
MADPRVCGGVDLDDIALRGTRGSFYSPIGFGELAFLELLGSLTLCLLRTRTQQRRDDGLACHHGEAMERFPLDPREVGKAFVLQGPAGAVGSQYSAHRTLGPGLGRWKDYEVLPVAVGATQMQTVV